MIQGFRFTSGYDPTGTATGGIGVGSLRVRDLVVVGNQFEPTMLSAISIRASRAVIDGNYARGLGALCGFCLTGPGHFEVTRNRLIDGGFVGIFLAPVAVLPSFPMGMNDPSIVVAPFVAPPVAAETAVVVNNEVRDHVRQPRGVGTGIWLVTFSANAEGGQQSSHVTLSSNTLLHNNFALVVDANTPPTSPAAAGNVTLSIADNDIGPSCRNNLLVSFTRFSRSIGVPPSSESFLHNTAYKLTLNGNTSWSDAWYDHPDGIGNTLEVDGSLIASGKRTSPSDNPAGC